MQQLCTKANVIITFFMFGGTQAYADFTHIATSGPMVDSNTLDEHSAVSIDNTLEDGKRIVFSGSYDSIFANIPANSGSLSAIYIGILKAGHTLSRVDDFDFEFAYKFYHMSSDETRRVRRIQATVKGGFGASAATNIGTDRDLVFFHDYSVSGKFFGTDTGVTAGTGASMTTPTVYTHNTTNVSTADVTIVIASSGPLLDLSTLTFSEVNNPTIDTTAPTMTITSSEVSDGDTSNDGTLSLTFTSSEATTDFVVGDITVSGGALSSFSATSSTVYTATFTPSGSGATTVDVAGGAFTDAAGNNNTAATQFNWTYDGTAPALSSVSIASNNSTNTQAEAGDVVTLTFTASEAINTPVVTFQSGGAAINDTSITYANTSGNTWTAAYTVNASDTSGAVTFSIAFSDTAGNTGTAVTSGTGSVSASLDATAPTMTITSSEVSDGDTSNDGTLSLTFTSSEATTDFVVGDITVSGGALSSFSATSSTVYTATFTPSGSGATTVDVAGGAFTDAAGNNNTAATQFNWTYDGTAPALSSVSIASNNSTNTQAEAGDVVTLTFTASEAINTPVVTFQSGGAAINDTSITYANTSGNTWTAAYTVNASDTSGAVTFSIAFSDTAGNTGTAVTSGTGSVAVTTTPSPASEFAAKEDAIRSVITDDAQRSLNSTLASNTRLTRDARERFLSSWTKLQSEDAVLINCNNEALDVDGTADASVDQIATQGTFSAQTGNFEGTQCRLVFGDFDIQRDGDTGSTTATINGKVAWEQMLSEQTMLGYYLGGEVARSNIQGSFTGTQDKYGVSVGGYFVHALQEHVFLDGFASLGAGRNNLEMADDTLALTSEYTTQTVTLGAAVSGVIEQNGYDILPELSIAYGKTTIGRVGFTGVAYGLTDDTLSLDAGSVSTATIMFRPELRVSLDGQKPSESLSTLSFAPRMMCERVQVASTTNNCGFGAELGFTSSTQDGLTSLIATITADRVGSSTRSSLQLNLEHKF